MPQRYRMGYRVSMVDSKTADIDIYGEIASYQFWGDEITASTFANDLKKAKDAEKLNIYVNTPGGDVFEAMAMRSEIMKHSAKEKNVYITGMCASAGTLLMCLSNANISMYDGSMMMIHYPSTFCYGNVEDIEKTGKALQEVTDNVIQLYADKTGLSEEELKDYMSKESYFTADKAIELGFANDIVKEKSANAQMSMQAIKMCGYKNVPKELIEKEERKNKMDLKDLKEKEPQLFEQIIEMGRSEERERIKALDEVYAPNDEQVVFEAKYGENKLSAEKLCVKQNKKAREQAKIAQEQQKEQGEEYIKARQEATASMEAIEQSEEESDTGEREQAIARIAKMADKIGGIK